MNDVGKKVVIGFAEDLLRRQLHGTGITMKLQGSTLRFDWEWHGAIELPFDTLEEQGYGVWLEQRAEEMKAMVAVMRVRLREASEGKLQL